MTTVDTTPISVLQSGMGWFPQQAGGLNRMYHNLVRTLPAVGVDVQGLVTGSQPLSLSLPANRSATVIPFARTDAGLPRRMWNARRIAKRMFTERSPDLVASHFALYTLPWLDLLDDVPLVVHFHGPWAAEGRVEASSSPSVHLKKQIEQVVYGRANRIIVLSDAFRAVLQDAYGVSSDRIVRIPGGVDVEAFDVAATPKEACARLGWPLDRPIVFAVRRLAKRMGLENLIEAVARLRRDVPDVLLLIAGKGPLHGALSAQIYEHGLQESVHLLGFVSDEDLPYAYRGAALSIVPTIALEGFGLITIESLAAGTPVLVTPVGGLPEVVSPLSTDLVLAGPSPAELSDGLRQALLAPEALPSSVACRSYARAQFDWSVIAHRTRNVYDDVLRS